MKQNRKAAILILLALLCTALLATGTYAAYTSVKYVKRVITTKSTAELLNFSSNYLLEDDQISPKYTKKSVTAGDDGFTINLDIYNFSLKDITGYSKSNITYTLEINLMDGDKPITDPTAVNRLLTLTAKDGSTVLGSHTLTGGSANTHSYVISCSADNVQELRQYKIRIMAIPENMGTKMLAADLELVSSSQSTHWTGRLVEMGYGTAEELDAFNFEISGTAKELCQLTWDSSKVALSPWSKADLEDQIVEIGGNYITLSLGGEGKPTDYQLQFYKVSDFTGFPTINLDPNT